MSRSSSFEQDQKIKLFSLIVVLLAEIILCLSVDAQVYKVQTTAGQGSAVHLSSGIFVSAKHVFPVGGNGSVSDGEKWHQIYSVYRDPVNDLASFRVSDNSVGSFESTTLVDGVPAGSSAALCGFSARREFCLQVAVKGNRLTHPQNLHSLPGDSGGGVFVQTGNRRGLVGVHFGYSCYMMGGRCETLFVPSLKIRRFLTQTYPNCPECVQFEQWNQPQSPSQPQYQPQQLTPQRQPQGPSAVAGGCTVVVDYEKLAKLFYDRYGQQLQGRDGNDGNDGQSPQVDLDRLADMITQSPVYSERIRGQRGGNGQSAQVDYQKLSEQFFVQYGDQLRGRDGTNGTNGINGTDGVEGPRGLVGVPDEQDIRNWLVGASSDPQTQQMLATILADIVATDPRVEDLIQRLERLEEGGQETVPDGRIDSLASRLTAVESRKNSQRVLLVDGKTNTVIDDETYIDKPIILDIQKFIRAAK